jgi:hypothetical protein
MQREAPTAEAEAEVGRTTATRAVTRAVAQLMEAMEMRVEQAGKQVEGAWWTADASRRQKSWGCGKEGERGSSCG